MKLIIVESYNKIKSIKKFLGNEYEVIASGGHIRELKSSGYGFNKDTLEPIWVPYEKGVQNKENKTIDQVLKYASNAEQIYLATDPDREGESISWHLYDILNDSDKPKCKRIAFNEITKKAVEKAISEPRDIDMNLVESQWARRLLDRLVGYGLSSLVKSKLQARSAGRVQSVALLFIVERFLEIQSFVPEYWWTIDTELKAGTKKVKFPIYLREASMDVDVFRKENKELEFSNKAQAEDVLKQLQPEFEVYKIDEPKVRSLSAWVPFETDTLLTTAYTKLGWSTSRTTKVAQELYNGILLDDDTVSLISYPRTDTNRLNDDFVETVKTYITDQYGKDYVSTGSKKVSNKNQALVQGAHEGIRPIDISITPDSIKSRIKSKGANDILSLYTLIWRQTVAAFMLPPSYIHHAIRFLNNENKFYVNYSRLHFKGYYALPYFDTSKIDSEIDLSFIQIGDKIKWNNPSEIKEHQTSPPDLFNEGSLVKELKKSGVGRPSTYSTMVNIVKDRGYVVKQKQLSPTPLGVTLIENLLKECSAFISKEFTIKMESELDEIANGGENWNKWIRGFKLTFDNQMLEARKNMKKIEPELVGRKCPNCNNELVYKINRRDRTKFIGCSNYSVNDDGCKYIESIKTDKPAAVLIDENCPECNSQLIQRYSNRGGKPFIACTGFPKCRYIKGNTAKPKEEK
ncbi:MAG: type I DNA topoisomerase [Mycoplasma sp.]